MNKETFVSAGNIAENALLFKALGDETRLKMIGLLGHGELCVCDLMEVLDLPQSKASRHLAYLRSCRWVVGRRSGKWMYYRLHPDLTESAAHKTLTEYVSGLAGLQKEYEKLKVYLERKGQKKSCS